MDSGFPLSKRVAGLALRLAASLSSKRDDLHIAV